MKIALAVPLRKGGSWGFLKYLVEILACWTTPDSGLSVDVILPEGILDEASFQGAGIIKTNQRDYKNGFRQMGSIISSGGYDVCLLTLPRVVPIDGVPVVAIVQNVEPIQRATYSMPLLWRMRLWALRREHIKALSRSTRIIAISRHVKNVLLPFPELISSKIDVIYHGFDTKELQVATRPDTAPDERFLFSAGSLTPYRGYEDLVRALAHLKLRQMTTPRLFLTGSVLDQSWYAKRLRRLISDLGVSGQITWAGILNRPEMNWSYQNCDLYVQTSRAEACPNIVLEAMGHGCEIISCNNPPMPEILGECADYYPTTNHIRLAECIQAHLDNQSVSGKKLRPSAPENRIEAFSWRIIASQTLDLLRTAAGSRS